ncbi:unnamed protein product [Withania somnifera]
MQNFQLTRKTQYSNNSIVNLIIISCFGCMIYLHFDTTVSLQDDENFSSQTNLDHAVFGIASNELSWSKRKEYVKLWWKPNRMRVSLPPICISEDTSNFRYTHRGGTPSAIRVSHFVLETVQLNHSDVRWFVFGDEDTVFFPENLMDFRGNVFGMLATNPVRTLVSMHHIEEICPIFPNMTTVKALAHLYNAASVDPHPILQQTVCYDRWSFWIVSASWEFAVQVFDKPVLLPNVQCIQESYAPWKSSHLGGLYDFDTKKYESEPCQRHLVYFLDKVSSGINGTEAIYKKKASEECKSNMPSPRRLEEIRVLSSKLVLDKQQLLDPRRHRCDVLPSTSSNVMEIGIRECKEDELIYMQH